MKCAPHGSNSCLRVDPNFEGLFLSFFSMSYRDFSVKLKMIISLFQAVFSIYCFKKYNFHEIVSFICS